MKLLKIWQTIVLAAVLAAPAAAQTPTDPLSAALKRQWDGIALNLKESAEVVPADRYQLPAVAGRQDVRRRDGTRSEHALLFLCAHQR